MHGQVTQKTRQAEYWDTVAGHIQASDAPDKNLVGYHSPYDTHVRAQAVRLLDKFAACVARKDCIAELGSGAGLNLQYFSRFKPKKMLAFDCSSQLLALAKSNLSSLNNIEFIHTDSYGLAVPPGASIDLLFTVTVLQHITDPQMYSSVVSSMTHSKARYILIIEDTRRKPRQVTPGYTLRSPADYTAAFDKPYALVKSEFVSLSWASRLFGVFNRLFGLYKRPEGSKLPPQLFSIMRFLSPVARFLDRLIPGKFGMSAMLFELRT